MISHSGPDFDELRAEWASPDKVGRATMQAVLELCKQVSRNYLARDYSENDRAETPFGHVWNVEELDELEMRTWRWLLEGTPGKKVQFDYASDTATTLEHWQNLIRKQIKHMLAHRSNKTVIDNHVERARTLLRDLPEFELERIHGKEWFCLGSPPAVTQDDLAEVLGDLGRIVDSGEFAEARRNVSLVPQRKPGPGGGGQRAHTIWDNRGLTTCLKSIGTAYPRGFTLNHVEEIFKNLLTHWDVPGLTSDMRNSNPNDSEGLMDTLIDVQHADPYRSITEEEALLGDGARRLLEGFDETDREILRRHLFGESLEKIGRDLDIGVRQKVAKQRDSLILKLQSRVRELIEEGLDPDEADDLAQLVVALVSDAAENGDHNA